MKYKTFLEIFTSAKERPVLIRWLYFLLANLLLGFILLALRSAINASREANKYPSKQYKKVIKEGILWDSIEYHER